MRALQGSNRGEESSSSGKPSGGWRKDDGGKGALMMHGDWWGAYHSKFAGEDDIEAAKRWRDQNSHPRHVNKKTGKERPSYWAIKKQNSRDIEV